MTVDPVLLIGVLVLAVLVAWFVFGRKNKASDDTTQTTKPSASATEQVRATGISEPASFFSALARSRSQLSTSLKTLFSGGFDEEIREDLEAILLSSDVGVDTTDWVLETLEARSKQDGITDANGLLRLLKEILASTLSAAEVQVDESANKPHVVLMIGVNGVGKTTTIGKLA
ncbi:MAG: signal recognition particle receptor subunit alpha, partial [Litorivicinaceae bacterium]